MALIKLKERVIEAFAATRDISQFPQLSAELSNQFSKNWAVGSFREAMESLKRGSLDTIEFIVICVDRSDESNLEPVLDFIDGVKARGAKTILVANDVSPTCLHKLLQKGADNFVPYPFPDDAFSQALVRLREQDAVPEVAAAPGKRRRKGIILPVFGLAGGVGATTFAVNLAWELATHDKKSKTRVAILDLNFQSGSVATYLDIGRRDAVAEMLTDIDNLDAEIFAQSLTSYKSRMAVLTAPPETLPLDIIDSDAVHQLLTLAQASYDYVIVDLPPMLVNWSSDVLQMAETYFAIINLDMRSAQNLMRFIRTVKAEELPEEKIQYILNFAPSFTNVSGKARAKRFSESLGIDINILLPDGGKGILTACDQGQPLAESAPKNPLRKEIGKISASITTTIEEMKAAIV
ncbi:MAG: AAA family ATPase [Paracoccaceae bacterium]